MVVSGGGRFNPTSLLITDPGPKGDFGKGNRATFGGRCVFQGGLALSLQADSVLPGWAWAQGVGLRDKLDTRKFGSQFNLHLAGRKANQESEL